MTTPKSKALCSGCRDNFYNKKGNSPDGECWMFERAKVIERTRVGTWQEPPYVWLPEPTLNCHHPQGQHWITQDDPRIACKCGKFQDECVCNKVPGAAARS